MGNEIEILWYLYKLYNIRNKFIWTFEVSQIINEINFEETINWWQWELNIQVKWEWFNIRNDIYCIKVFYIIKKWTEFIENHLYTWILDKVEKDKELWTIITFSFLWLTYLYNNTTNLKVIWNNGQQSPIYTYEENSSNLTFIWDRIFTSVWYTIIKVSNTYTVLTWDKLVWETSWVEAYAIGSNIEPTDDLYVSIFKQNWEFQIWENISVFNKVWDSYVNSWHNVTLTEYYKNNFNSYFLDLDTKSNIQEWWNQNIKVEDSDNISLLDKLLELNPNFYYYLNKNWILTFKSFVNSDITPYTLTFWKEINRLVKTKDIWAVKNYILLKSKMWWDTSFYTAKKDSTSIEKYGLRQEIIEDDTLLDSTTIEKRLEAEIEKKKETLDEIEITCNINNFISNQQWIQWNEMTNSWNTYNVEFQDLISWNVNIWTVLDINIWDRINVRNIDNNLELTDLLVVRKEFYWKEITFFCNSYKRNVYKNIKFIK